MIFNSIEFLIFLPIVFLLYWSLRKLNIQFQNLFLLAASYVFYGWWDVRFLSLIVFSTGVDYVVGLKMAQSGNSKSIKKKWLLVSLITNLGILGFFKYFNFFVDSFIGVLDVFGLPFDTWSLQIILPVGISFYTFQTLSYSIDIYRDKIKPTKDFLAFAAFVSFFPQLVAGPIERASHLLPQFLNKRVFNYQNAFHGLTLILYGFFKKVVIADRLAPYVNNVFDDVGTYNTPSILLAAFFFAIQIYCDFSGYSLIARGLSKWFGFDLMVNFNKPYLAHNFNEFWRRWHISLSSWFRDYLYIPLGGNRVPEWRMYLNFLIVFLVSGLWHGANWTFVIWGGVHGVFLMLNQLALKFKIRASKFLGVVITLPSVIWAYVWFRADSLSSAVLINKKIFEFDLTYNLTTLCAERGVLNLVVSFFVIGLLVLSYLLPRNLKFKNWFNYFLVNAIFLFLIYILGVNERTEFIYFQF